MKKHLLIFIHFPPSILNYTFPFTIFLLFFSIFPFFLASLFPVGQQKFPGEKASRGHSAPPGCYGPCSSQEIFPKTITIGTVPHTIYIHISLFSLHRYILNFYFFNVNVKKLVLFENGRKHKKIYMPHLIVIRFFNNDSFLKNEQ